jgi:RNA polymerase-interacting CarD/CdnL/TRCF family regulator
MSEIVDMKFDIGDKVVHPQHGVGHVADVEEKQFEPNTTRTYYVVLIPATTLWVPVNLSSSGLRRLGAKSDLDQCRQVLQSPRSLSNQAETCWPVWAIKLKRGRSLPNVK